MEENKNNEYNEYRRKRVKRFKRIILVSLAFFVALPNVLCVFLFLSINKTNTYIQSLAEELNILKISEVEKVVASETKSTYDAQSLVEQDFVFKVLPDAEEYPGYQRIYLTFDDGPSRYTNELLDVLLKYNVKATFFVLAQDGYDDQYNRIINEGHTLGIHSYKHVYSDLYSDLNGFENDVNSVSDFIFEKTGTRPEFYRFPGGSSNTIYKGDKNELFDYLSDNNLVYFDWNVASNDATFGGLGKSQIANNVLNGIKGKDEAVILMHDANDKHSTIEALEIIIQSLQAEENVVFLPITSNTEPVQHIKKKD
ncbi:MAG: polysaccharide deacetylase [Lachnospiraceae bacterium]|nr:polysaccharide deacetylase [Lachnospiraceae bacterium]